VEIPTSAVDENELQDQRDQVRRAEEKADEAEKKAIALQKLVDDNTGGLQPEEYNGLVQQAKEAREEADRLKNVLESERARLRDLEAMEVSPGPVIIGPGPGLPIVVDGMTGMPVGIIGGPMPMQVPMMLGEPVVMMS
jgi:hypothetical protein